MKFIIFVAILVVAVGCGSDSDPRCWYEYEYKLDRTGIYTEYKRLRCEHD